MVCTGRGASISPVMPLPLGRVPSYTVRNVGLEGGTGAPLVTYSLLTWFSHIFVGFKKRSDVLRLTAPNITMNGPIESELEASPI